MSVETFELIGESNRMAILRALVDVESSSRGPHLSFTDLKQNAGIDDTGQFNYHLGKLVGTLIVHEDAGYRLSRFARRILRPIAAGYYDPDMSVRSLELPGSCPQCNDSLSVQLQENVLQVVCESDHVVNYGLIASPGILTSHSTETALSALGVLSTHTVEQATHNICPNCHASIQGRVQQLGSIGIGADLQIPESMGCYVFWARCASCGNRVIIPVGGCIITYPAVVELYAAHDIDIRSTVPWVLPFRQAGAEELLSRNPLRVGLWVGEELAGESLYVTVGQDGAVQALYHFDR